MTIVKKRRPGGATKDAVKAASLTVVADAGYSNGADAAACERDGITARAGEPFDQQPG